MKFILHVSTDSTRKDIKDKCVKSLLRVLEKEGGNCCVGYDAGDVMSYSDLQEAAKVFYQLGRIRNYVSRDRFDMVAKTQYGIEDDRKLDVMYGLLNMTGKIIYYIANEDDESIRTPEYLELMPLTIEIAQSAFALMNKGKFSLNLLPVVDPKRYDQKDERRYFYQKKGKEATIDIDLSRRDGVILFGKLLQCEDVKITGVAKYLGHLEGKMNESRNREKHDYYDGDIYLLYADPTDRVFYDWFSHGNDAGVYLATDNGWRKLLYTPGRGYIDTKGNLQFVDEKKYYSNYMLEKSGMGFRYVGNIHQDHNVLVEKREVEQ